MSFLGTITSIAKPFAALNPIIPFATAAASLLGGERRNAAQSDAANAQMAFQSDMSGSSYQRAVQDMKLAGLNPMLAYSQGGASTPVGAMPQFQDSISSAIQSGVGAMTGHASAEEAWSRITLNTAQLDVVDQTVDKIKQEIANLKSDDERIKATVLMLSEQTKLFKQQGNTAAASEKMMYETAKQLVEQTKLLKYDVDAASKLGNIGREFGQLKPVVDVLIQILQATRPRGGGITINK